ncbi:MAG: HAD family hydrolase [Chloroflexi bacterium]|nr:HAD family hydrolase [Chloroflexota bacterium]
MKHPIVFLDKDGTLVKDEPYNVDPEKIALAAGAAQGLRRLYEAGYRFIVVSNQSGVARGFFSEEALGPVETRLDELLRLSAGAALEAFYYCPHHPEGSIARYAVECGCRKPKPGLLLRAAVERGIRLEDAWMIGDILDDIEAGNRAGCRTILIQNGNETEWLDGSYRSPDFYAGSLDEAAEIILAEVEVKSRSAA